MAVLAAERQAVLAMPDDGASASTQAEGLPDLNDGDVQSATLKIQSGFRGRMVCTFCMDRLLHGRQLCLWRRPFMLGHEACCGAVRVKDQT